MRRTFTITWPTVKILDTRESAFDKNWNNILKVLTQGFSSPSPAEVRLKRGIGVNDGASVLPTLCMIAVEDEGRNSVAVDDLIVDAFCDDVSIGFPPLHHWNDVSSVLHVARESDSVWRKSTGVASDDSIRRRFNAT